MSQETFTYQPAVEASLFEALRAWAESRQDEVEVHELLTYLLNFTFKVAFLVGSNRQQVREQLHVAVDLAERAFGGFASASPSSRAN